MENPNGPGGGPGSPEFTKWLADQKANQIAAKKAQEGLANWERDQAHSSDVQGTRVYEAEVPVHLKFAQRKPSPRQSFTAGHDVKDD